MAHNLRLLVLDAGAGWAHLGSSGLGASLCQLSADWQAEWRPAWELAETFGAPSRCRGTVDQTTHGLEVGHNRGSGRFNGRCAD